MKKVILTAVALMATLSIYAQGKMTFANDATSLVTIKDKDTSVVSTAPTGGAYVVGLWWGNAGAGEAGLQFMTGSASSFSPLAGRFNKSYTVPTATPGPIVDVQVRAWQASFGTDAAGYASALAGGYSGKSTVFQVDTSDPAVTTDQPGSSVGKVFDFTSGAPGVQMTVTVPEPSTIALGLLGLAGLFVLRRRS